MTSPSLQAVDLTAGYHGHAFIHGVDLHVDAGEVVALLGPNGAGKTTTLMTLAGEIAPLAGTVKLGGRETSGPLHRRARQGLSFVTEQRSVFAGLTVMENLKVGRADVDRAVGLFSELRPLLNRRGGVLSGGELQMLTLARALTRKTKILLIDELSLGLAPLAVERLIRAVRAAADEGEIGILLVEQQVESALGIADRVYVMRRGEIVLTGDAEDVASRVLELEDSYLAANVHQRGTD